MTCVIETQRKPSERSDNNCNGHNELMVSCFIYNGTFSEFEHRPKVRQLIYKSESSRIDNRFKLSHPGVFINRYICLVPNTKITSNILNNAY